VQKKEEGEDGNEERILKGWQTKRRRERWSQRLGGNETMERKKMRLELNSES